MSQQDSSTSAGAGTVRTIALFGSYHAAEGGEDFKLAYDIGNRLAKAGFEVLNGGYEGTMRASSQGAKEAGGSTVGITCPSVLRSGNVPLEPNPFLDEVLPAPDILARVNAMMQLSGGFVVLDGGTGTLCELAIVWEYVSKGFIPPRPIVLAGRAWDALADRMGDYRESSRKHIHRAETPEQVVAFLEEHALRGTRSRTAASRAVGLDDHTVTVAKLREIMDRFVDERDWQPFHDPKNLAASIAIEAAELMEHFQWLRSDQLDEIRRDEAKMAAIGEELADILAFVLSFASTMEIDLSSTLADKMQKNAIKYPADEYRGRFEVS